MSDIRFFKFIKIPQNIRRNSIYAIKVNQNYYKLYISDNVGNLLELNSENSNRLNGYLPSAIPNPNVLVLSDTTGKIDYGFLPNIYNSYGRLRVGTVFPDIDIKENDLFYNTSNNKLFIRKGSSWIEIDWQTIVRASPEWNSRLRINNNQLQISPDGINWFNCIPAVGCSVIEILNIDNSNYSLLYWISSATTVIVKNANHLPIVYAKDVEPTFIGTYWHNMAYGYWIGLRPSNVAISNGNGQYIAGNRSLVEGEYIGNMSIVPILKQSNTRENWAYFSLNIRIGRSLNRGIIQRWLTTSIGQGYLGYVVVSCVGSGTTPLTSYWLGTWFGQDNIQFTMTKIIITRLT